MGRGSAAGAGPAPGDQAAAWIAGAALIAVAAVFLGRVGPALAPSALWNDDLWVAALARRFDPSLWVSVHPAVPVGFVAVLAGALRLGLDPVWGLQVAPLAAVLAAAAALGAFVRRAGAPLWAALALPAVLLAAPDLGVFATRVKQYTTELLFTTLLLNAALEWVRARELRSLWWTLATFILGTLFGFAPLFTGLALLAAPLSWGAGPKEDASAGHGSRWRLPAPVVAAGLWTVAMYLGIWRHQANPAMRVFWADHMLPWPTDGGGWRAWHAWLNGPVATFFGRALVTELRFAAWLVPVGVAMLWRRGDRGFSLASLALFGGLLGLNALHVFPLGTIRTDLHCHPVVLLLAGWPVYVAMTRGCPPRWRSPLLAVLLAAVTAAAAVKGPVAYPASRDVEALRAGLAAVEGGETMILLPGADAVYAYAAPEAPGAFIDDPRHPNGFAFVPSGGRTLLLPYVDDRRLTDTGGADWRGDLAALHAASGPGARAVMVAAFTPAGRLAVAVSVMTATGFRLVERRDFGPDAAVLVWEI